MTNKLVWNVLIMKPSHLKQVVLVNAFQTPVAFDGSARMKKFFLIDRENQAWKCCPFENRHWFNIIRFIETYWIDIRPGINISEYKKSS